jgi:hypothetical protein
VRCRRSTFERVLRVAAERQPGLALRIGHVDQVCASRGRATGVRTAGATLDAELIPDFRRSQAHECMIDRVRAGQGGAVRSGT